MRFDYHRAITIEEALFLLARHKGEAKVIAGGTDLLIQARNKKIKPVCVVDITSVADLDHITYDPRHGLTIGAVATIHRLATSAAVRQSCPVLSAAASQLGSPAIRNVATVGGNLCNASPSAETAQALLALHAETRIVGSEGERIVPLERFFTGPGATVLGTGELLTEIHVPVPPPGTRGVYLKHSMRGSIDLAIVNFAVVVTMEAGDSDVCRDISMVIGAVAQTPLRAYKAEEILRGKRIDGGLLSAAAQVASDEARPRAGSIRGSVEYKKKMIKFFIPKLVREAMGIDAGKNRASDRSRAGT
jgi:carbon-monoxide dehydrogenase medium subunit